MPDDDDDDDDDDQKEVNNCRYKTALLNLQVESLLVFQ